MTRRQVCRLPGLPIFPLNRRQRRVLAGDLRAWIEARRGRQPLDSPVTLVDTPIHDRYTTSEAAKGSGAVAAAASIVARPSLEHRGASRKGGNARKPRGRPRLGNGL